MRFSTRLLLPLFLLLLLVGAYTLYWWRVAQRLGPAVALWAQKERAQMIDASWRKMEVTGYPFFFRVNLEGAVLRDRAITPSARLELPLLSARAWPWNLAEWQFSAPKGLAALPFGSGTPGLSAASARGTLSLAASGGGSLSLRLEKAGAARVVAEEAAVRIALPQKTPRKEGAQAFSLAVRLKEMKLPFAPAGLGGTIAKLSFAITVKGNVAPGPIVRMAKAWRAEGGTIALDHLRLGWGALGANGSGTLALDSELQPEGAFSGTIEGYDAVVAALVASGRMRREAGGLARIALRLLSKMGPDGKREIATSLTIEHGEISLGPAKLGRLPRLSWSLGTR